MLFYFAVFFRLFRSLWAAAVRQLFRCIYALSSRAHLTPPLNCCSASFRVQHERPTITNSFGLLVYALSLFNRWFGFWSCSFRLQHWNGRYMVSITITTMIPPVDFRLSSVFASQFNMIIIQLLSIDRITNENPTVYDEKNRKNCFNCSKTRHRTDPICNYKFNRRLQQIGRVHQFT